MNINDLQSYEVILSQHIEEVNSEAYLLKHKKSGARVVVLSNDDDNKVFHIGFRTPVADDTGCLFYTSLLRNMERFSFVQWCPSF